jgi:hypothetical protein
MMCWGCQPIGTFAVCGESYGMSGKGLCESKPILIGDWEMEQHYFKKTNLFAFIAGPSGNSLGRSGSDFISVTTNNHQYPTSSEIKLVEEVLSGIAGEK